MKTWIFFICNPANSFTLVCFQASIYIHNLYITDKLNFDGKLSIFTSIPQNLNQDLRSCKFDFLKNSWRTWLIMDIVMKEGMAIVMREDTGIVMMEELGVEDMVIVMAHQTPVMLRTWGDRSSISTSGLTWIAWHALMKRKRDQGRQSSKLLKTG